MSKIQTQPALTPEEQSKDEFFRQIARVGEEMVATHGRDFATGAFILAARWITEGKLGKEAPPLPN